MGKVLGYIKVSLFDPKKVYLTNKQLLLTNFYKTYN